MTEAGKGGALRRGSLITGVAFLLIAAVLGSYTVLAHRPDCADLYLCRRVVDRTILLGTTSVAAAAGAALLLAAERVMRRGIWVIRALLILGAVVLATAYWKTQFGSLRADLAEQMALTPTMWTASAALWLAIMGFLGAASGVRPK